MGPKGIINGHINGHTHGVNGAPGSPRHHAQGREGVPFTAELIAGGAYRGALEDTGVMGKVPSMPFFSSVTGSRLADSKLSQLGPKYWEANMVRPVLSKAAVGAIIAAKDVVNEVFLELGPHSALAGPLRQTLMAESSKAPYVATLVRRQNSVENLLQAIGKLLVLQVPLDLASLVPSGACVSRLPCYPWDHQRRYLFESRLAKAWRGRDGVSFRNISVSSALVLDENASTETVTALRRVRLTDKLDSEWWEFSVASHSGHISTKHCWGEVRGEMVAPTVDGLTYDPTFKTTEDVKTSTQWPHRATSKAEYHIHPIILDTQFQLLSCALTRGISRTYQRTVASRIENMTLTRCADDMVQVSVISEPTAESIWAAAPCTRAPGPSCRSPTTVAPPSRRPLSSKRITPPSPPGASGAPQADFKALGDLMQHPPTRPDR
ncbi:hypothetical protein diail_5748, partial [Diaporthe ilicicola]